MVELGTLEYHLESTLNRMIQTGIISRKTHMVIVARDDLTIPDTFQLLGKQLPVHRDNRIPFEQAGEMKTSTVYLMRRKDYNRMIKHAP